MQGRALTSLVVVLLLTTSLAMADGPARLGPPTTIDVTVADAPVLTTNLAMADGRPRLGPLTPVDADPVPAGGDVGCA